MSRSLAELTADVLAFRDARAWARFHTPKNLAMAIAAEAGELCDLFRWMDDAETRERLGEPAFQERVALELADLAMLVLLAAEASGVSLEEAVARKLALNEARYPVEKAHGTAKKYDEL